MFLKWLPSSNKYWPTYLWALFILLLCAIPGQDLPKVWWMELLSIDKPVHATLFFVMTLLLYRNLTFLGKPFLTAITSSLIFSMAYGGALEIMQGAYFENRSADIYDFVANTTGAILACYIIYRKRI